MEAERGDCLRINAPEWYARADFMAWLNDPEGHRATWHERGQAAGEYSDVFVTFDHCEGSDFDASMPEDIVQAIRAAAADCGVEDGIVWISNVGEVA